ncbi:uncharacterized protein LOC113751992 [Coffea eugenioides]|uniref:uncharacterized protein LOC113751992 n=1 Tax=Coffea eugenioides TaxID=49369 RepID=UPI000F6158C6|nr:uncharacterized protein LOC113751992 [Coffea eugenioides]
MVAGGSSTAAPQPLADGGPCSPSTAKSFAQLFSQPIESPIQVKPTTKYKGEAAVVFSKAEADKLATPFRWALVGKFSYGRPSLEGDSEFHVKKESALVPVWASLPALPVHYFDKHSLFSILAPVGKPLFLDSATAAGMRPSVARVCVEAQVVKQREAAEAVEEAKGGVSTPGEIGESTRAELMVGQPSILAGDGGKSQADTAAEAATTDPVQQAVRSLVADATLTLLQSTGQVDGAPDWDRPIGPLATEGVLTEQVEAGVEGMRSNAACGQLRESGQDATAAGQEGQVACDGREGTLDGEQGVRDTQQADAGQLILLYNSELGSLVVDLSGREEVPHDSQGDVDIGLSPVAGNLSPRLVVRQERVGESAVVALNIDQSQAVERDAKQARGKGVRARIPSDRQLRSATSSHNSFQAKFVAICEPKLDVSRIESIRLRLHFDFVLVNCSGDIWVFYNSPFVCSMVGNSSQHLSLSVQSPLMPGSIIMSFVHAKCSVEERRELWSNLVADKPSSLPWCIGGDFNVIMAPHEKRGGRPFAVAEGVEFMSFLEEAGVFDVGFSGPSFTWCNNRRGRARVSKRLDRLLVNGKCLDFSAAISVVHLARHPSNHAPLKISFASLIDNKPRPFRFLNVWTTKPDLLEVIRHAWGQEASGSPLRVLCSKLLAARRAIQVWNKQCFGNVIDAVREAEQTVQRAEEAVDHDDSEAGQVELRKAQAELRYALSIEEQYWSQKARVKWLRSGDRNSRYFHAVVRQRRAQGLIHRIKKSNGDWVDTDAEIASEAITYFSNLFAGPLEAASDMLHLIPPLITTEDNCMFEAAPNIEEVHQVVRAMDGDSAADPDGFTGKFYTFAWEVIAQDVYNASGWCLAKDYLPQQSGFVKGRNISENYLLAQEVVVGIGKKARGGNVVLKLDMSKAYDRVSWLHIIEVLRRFGFGERFIDMGDPLSPTLFIIAAEVLSRGLNALMVQSGFLGFKVPYGCPSITHLAFADDVLIFANGSSSSLKDIMQVLEMYQRCSGQLISAQKNGYLVHPSLSLARRRVIERVTGFTWQPFPIRYLGFPLYFGRCKSSYYAAVGQSILGRVLSWKSKFLSAGGKMVLIKHVLSSMPVHLLSAAVIPTSIFKSIEQNGPSLSGRDEVDGFGYLEAYVEREPTRGTFHGMGTLSPPSYNTRSLTEGVQMKSFGCHRRLARNKAVFEGEQMRSTVICQSIFSEVKSIVDIHFKQKLGVQTFCQLFDWSHLTTSVFDFKLVRWEVTAMGGLVLNTDGCSKGNPGVGGGGGVLRDSTRMPLVAFLAFFGETTCLRAETWGSPAAHSVPVADPKGSPADLADMDSSSDDDRIEEPLPMIPYRMVEGRYLMRYSPARRGRTCLCRERFSYHNHLVLQVVEERRQLTRDLRIARVKREEMVATIEV